MTGSLGAVGYLETSVAQPANSGGLREAIWVATRAQPLEGVSDQFGGA